MMSRNYLKEDLNRREKVLESLGINQEDLRRDVDIFRLWGTQQRHLPQDDLDDDLFIERLLLNNKFRIEQSKVKLDNYYTSKAVYRLFYEDLWKIKPSEIPLCRITLKNLTPDGQWIILVCAREKCTKIVDLLECLKFHVAASEIMNKYCYSVSRVVIIDVKGIKSSLFNNFEAPILYEYLKLVKTCFSGRSSVYHIVNLSNWGSILYGGIRMIFKGEIDKKVIIHDNLESLYKAIPRKYLPKDYDGDDDSIEDYLEIWDDIIKEEEEYLKCLQYKIPNESLRVDKSPLKDLGPMFGMDGTFKKLNID